MTKSILDKQVAADRATAANGFKHVSTFAMDDGISVVVAPKVWKGKQSIQCEAVFRLWIGASRAWNGSVHGGHGEQVKVEIDRDSYDFQSSATVTIWDPRERRWNPLASLPYPMMQTTSAYTPDPITFDLFRADVLALLAEARAILGAYMPAHADAWRGTKPRFRPIL